MLTTPEREELEQLYEGGILEAVQPADIAGGAVILGCIDPTAFPDYFRALQDIAGRMDEPPLIAASPEIGGPLVFTGRNGEASQTLQKLGFLKEQFRLPRIVLHSHFPCRHARAKMLLPFAAINAIAFSQAALYRNGLYDVSDTSSVAFVNWGEEGHLPFTGMRTYRINRGKLRGFQLRQSGRR